MKRLLFLFVAALPAAAETQIQITAKVADVPVGISIPATAEKLDKIKGVDVLSCPVILTQPGKKAVIEITQAQSTPSGASVPLGVALEVTPELGEKTIRFTGKAVDRAIHGRKSDGGITAVEFATREIYFSGSTASGGTVTLNTAPATSKSAKADGGTVVKSRELVVFLTFKKIEVGLKSPPSTPAKKPVTPTKKPVKKK